LLDYIPVRMASTGSKRAADIAGKIPETRPIIADNEVPRRTLLTLRINSKSSILDKVRAMIQTKKSPINPPITAKITASNKN
jgi:hypothetical protein